ncbi:MAG: hypothetical protein MPN21_00560 [Thermoanaerobaculia bacterium]|nr:hypothetical protein [Thermoanaerobaculia bacterium]
MLRLRAIHLALTLVVVSGVGFAAIDAYLIGRPAFPLDDAWIHLQFASRLASGDGLAYSADRWVTGSTAPLWSALVSIGGLLPGRLILLWSEFLAVLAFAGTVLGAHRLTRELLPGHGKDLAGTAALLIATTPWLLWSAAAGMEITTFTCLALWGMVWHVREQRTNQHSLVRSAPVLAVAALARPEGLLLLGLAFGERCLRAGRSGRPDWTKLRTTVRSMLPALVIVSPTLIFYRVAGGSFLPTTFWTKAGSPIDPWPDTHYLYLLLNFFARSQPMAVLLAAGGILLLAVRLKGPSDRGVLPAAWLLAQALAYSLMTRPEAPPPMGNFGRYWFPLLPVVTILALVALSPMMRRLRGLRLWTPLLLLLFAAQLPGFIAMPTAYSQHVSDVEASDVAAAQWLAPRLDPDAYLAVQDVGALAFLLPNETLDLAGLTSPEIRPILFGSSGGSSWAVGDWQRRLHDYLRRERVDYLVVFDGSYPQVVRAPGFNVVRSFHNPDNRTMAGNVLLIVQTPWCRFPLSDRPTGPAA